MIYLHLNGKYKILFIWFMESEECTFPFGALTNEWALWSREPLIWEEDRLDLALNQETHFPRLKKESKGIRNARLSPMQKGQRKPKALYKVASLAEPYPCPLFPQQSCEWPEGRQEGGGSYHLPSHFKAWKMTFL